MKTNPDVFIKNTKLEHSNMYRGEEASIYASLLTNLYISRFEWSGNLPEFELAKIEPLLFKYGACAVVYPKKVLNNGVVIKAPFALVKHFNVVKYDVDMETPLKISINGLGEYTFDEFVIIKDFPSWQMPRLCVSSIVFNYADRLSLQDDLIKQHTNKQRMPIYSIVEKEQFNSIKTFFHELYNGALHLVMNKKAISNDKPLFNNVEIEYIVNEIYDVKDKIMQEFCSTLGIINNQDYNSDVYTNKYQVSLKSSFVINVANTQLNNRRDFQNKKMAKLLNLEVKTKNNIYGAMNELL